MKAKLKTLAVAVGLTAVVGGMTVQEAEAAPRSYFSYVEKFSHNPAIQENFVRAMIKNYTRTYNFFVSFVDRYARFAGYSFYDRLVTTRDWYGQELARYENALVEITSPVEEVVTVVNTETTTQVTYEEETSAPYEVDSVESVVEEVENNTVYVYAVLTKTFETKTVRREITTTVTTTYYSNNTTDSSSSTEVTGTEESFAQETTTARELVNQYAVVVETPEVEVADGEQGVKTLNVLTVEEYEARDDVNLIGTDTWMQAVLNMNSRINRDYITRESGLRIYGSTLEAVNAPEAWAKGWTGKGSKIAILDTGIDLDHSEFEGRIAGTKCFIGECDERYAGQAWAETVQDENRYSHGTHVAGIAAAALDGVGTTGVAPDAELLIGKVANKWGSYNLGVLGEALAWASNEGAVVANVSGNYNVSRAYSKAITQLNSDTYTLIDDGTAETQKMISYGYDKFGYANVFSEQYSWSYLTEIKAAFAENTEMVMVASAGNQRLGFSTFPAHLAVLADENGELVFDGRIIVAGNYNLRTEKHASSSNKAGTVCFDYNGNNSCDSGYRIKDFYLMAPGQYVAAPDKDGEYRTNSGTSMAAPVISGAVAIIHQMWPHMKGNNIAKLLLETGNKDIPNYDENIHGQGLLDLDAATSPQGVVGIPTGGRVDGARNDVNEGGVALNGVASISAFEQVMVVDDYDRDFYIDANSMVVGADTRTLSYTRAHMDKTKTNAYAGFANTQNAGGTNMLFGLSADGSEMNLAYDFDNGVAVGMLTEEGSFLGNVADSSLMRVNGATTAYAGYNIEESYGNVTFFGGATVGFTKAEVDSSSMMKSMDTLVSNTANIGTEFALTNNSSFGVVAGLPVAITNGSANFDVASSVSANGDLEFTSVSSDLSATAREYNVGAYYSFAKVNTQDVAVTVDGFVEERFNYKGVDGENETTAGVALKITF